LLRLRESRDGLFSLTECGDDFRERTAGFFQVSVSRGGPDTVEHPLTKSRRVEHFRSTGQTEAIDKPLPSVGERRKKTVDENLYALAKLGAAERFNVFFNS
jgi:hypothetical protein